MLHVALQQLAQVPYHFAWFSMPLGPRLGVDFLPIRPNLEAALTAPYQRDGLQVVTICLDKFFRHTDGARSVASFLAVKYLYFHHVASFLSGRLRSLCYVLGSRGYASSQGGARVLL